MAAPASTIGDPIVTDCHAEALRLLDLGYRPFAIDPATKAPWYPWAEYQHRPPTADELERWFSERPAAGLAISTNGLLVVDVDGPDTIWPPDRECCYDLMGVPQVATPRGGAHFYFRQTPGRPHAGTIGKLQPNVDTRADGNLVVLPPTKRQDGLGYEWVGEELDCGPEGLAAPPEWLQAAIDAIDTDRVSLYVAKPFSESIPQGQRNRTFFRLACLLRDTGCDESIILGALEGVNGRQADRLAGRELAVIAKSAAKYQPTPEVDLTGIAPADANPKVLSMAELEALPPPTWLIDEIIPDRGLGFFVGDAGSGKSLFMLAVANSVARGAPLFDQRQTMRQGWVLALLAESVASWGARSAAYNDRYGLTPTDNFGAIIEGVDFSTKQGIASLSAIIKQEINRRGEYPALIILDTLSSAIPGVDENAVAAVTPLLAALQGWVRHGIPAVVIHHPSKGGAAYRGSSAFMGNVDWMLGVEVRGSRHEIVRHKMRDMEWENPLAFEIVRHGNAPVAVPCAGPSQTFMALGEPGLKDALADHGMYVPGRTYHPAVPGKADLRQGVLFKDLLATWLDAAPITTDRAGYNAEYSRRRGALVKAINAMVADGALSVAGTLTNRSMAAVVSLPETF